jgi:hypothetical protein
VTDPSDIPKAQEALKCFEAATARRVNIKKSRAIAIGNSNKVLTVMNIPFHDTTILGFQIMSTVRESEYTSWTKTTAIIRTEAQEHYCRTMTLDMRIKYVHEYFMARAWYLAQIYPLPEIGVRHRKSNISTVNHSKYSTTGVGVILF